MTWSAPVGEWIQTVISRSNDGARTWSPPRHVNIGGLQSNHSCPMIAVNRDGLIAVSWNDRRDDPSDQCYRPYVAFSSDGGQSFVEQNVVAEPTCPGAGSRWMNGGETHGLAALSDGSFRVVWSGTAGDLGLWTAVVRPARRASHMQPSPRSRHRKSTQLPRDADLAMTQTSRRLFSAKARSSAKGLAVGLLLLSAPFADVVAAVDSAATGESTTAPRAACSEAFETAAVKTELTALARVAAAAPVWDEYSLARHPLLIVADSTYRGDAAPVCGAIWRHGEALRIVELVARPRLSTPLYGMISTESVSSRDSAGNAAQLAALLQMDSALASQLRSLDVQRAVVLQVPLDFARLGALGRMLQQAGADPALIHADLAVHESFHLHVQFPTWLGLTRTYRWPEWDRQPNRAELRERCYGARPTVTAALRDEHAALLRAFDALGDDGTSATDAVRSAASDFVRLRLARRKLIDTVTIAGDSGRVSCAEAEDILELEEGTAQWVGHATTVEAGLTTRVAKRTSYVQLQSDAFYQFGPLQLWVLRALSPGDTRRLTGAIAQAPSLSRGGSLFGRLRAITDAPR